jgi:hypothetical protein
MHGDQRFRFVSPSIGFAEEDQEFDPHVHYFRTVEGGGALFTPSSLVSSGGRSSRQITYRISRVVLVPKPLVCPAAAR